ncbi:Uncharacterized protein conserved in bacteria (plasmid) [Tsukamurella tyrosinosolvens]|uniref:Uncharacterized conserved protein n=1 Tax=Tsukamurella tyrosinosolvens TaxID=57704 RepID=A0A1H4ZQ50_TSUTY|nr:YciI family protein [Tsukamurella tyrosinosolvens]KXO95564.1 hypothetical protein AXK58_12780 [Tsukamurella tyrosinosolvens]SED32015.1 Uncharacterized conserved protein [Tsukamurella tyrosinosolvens]VEH99664.1 Uncharacterized protein conserved in bacteria [Tsukamurella tyrosinosolvens]
MKYVIMIHSHPQPWGHPTGDFLPEYRDLDPAVKARMDADFERLLTELDERGELVGGEALGDPVSARLYRWHDDAPLAVDGPYSETKEHLAGFFLIDVEDRQRAEAVAAQFAGPGETVELRPVMGPGGDES